MGSIRAILSLLLYAQCTLTMIFDFELASNKKLFQIALRYMYMYMYMNV
jgi:hypothetical protein